MEEEEAQRVISEQRKQMQQQDGAGRPGAGEGVQVTDTGLLVAPKLSYNESTEEQALKKQQVYTGASTEEKLVCGVFSQVRHI